MKPLFIEATSIDDGWHQIIWNLYEFGKRKEITAGSFAGSFRLQVPFFSGFIHRPHLRPLTVFMPEGCSIDPPTTEEKIQSYFVNYLMDPELAINEHYKYASWIVGGNSICPTRQLDWIIRHFKEAGFGNEHCTIVIGNHDSNLAYDDPFKFCPRCENKEIFWPQEFRDCPECGTLLEANELKRGTSPCLRLLDFGVENGCLTTHVVYRSWDAWGGWPENMGGFTLLNEFVAEQLDITPGPLSFSCKSLHAYSHHVDVIVKRLNK